MTARGRQIPTERRGFVLRALNAALVGSTDTGVLRFAGGAAVLDGNYSLASMATITTTAAEGTTIKFLRAGLWQVHVNLTLIVADTTVLAGISLDWAGTVPIVSNPTVTLCRDVHRVGITAAAAVTAGIKLVDTFPITDAMAGSSTLGVVRIHATNGANGAPTSLFVPECAAWFEYLGDLRG